jgi:hypothetical protein
VTQLALPLAWSPPADAAELLDRLRRLGLHRVNRVVLTRNRRTMVSVRGDVLRVHHGYLTAPEPVHAAIVALVERRGPRARRDARATILSHPVRIDPGPSRRERPHIEDASTVSRLADAHRRLNAERFGGTLTDVPIRVSRRMRRRLGHYRAATETEPAEISLSRRHVRRHGWQAALETLLHEMVHQWQAETGHALDHGPAFRRKAREVGIAPRAGRVVPTP